MLVTFFIPYEFIISGNIFGKCFQQSLIQESTLLKAPLGHEQAEEDKSIKSPTVRISWFSRSLVELWELDIQTTNVRSRLILREVYNAPPCDPNFAAPKKTGVKASKTKGPMKGSGKLNPTFRPTNPLSLDLLVFFLWPAKESKIHWWFPRCFMFTMIHGAIIQFELMDPGKTEKYNRKILRSPKTIKEYVFTKHYLWVYREFWSSKIGD